MKKIIFITLFISMYPSFSFGCDYSLRYLHKIPLFVGGVQDNKARLQSPASNVSGSQFEFLCTLAESHFLFGLGYDKENKKLFLRDGNPRDFNSEYSNAFLKLGYSYVKRENLNLEFAVKGGHGKTNFTEKNSSTKKITDVYSVGADARIVKPFEFGILKIEFIGGAGIQKTFVPSFHYNGRYFSSDEFGVSANFLIGVGLRF